MATRQTLDDPFVGAKAAVATPGDETPSWISQDGCRLYFSSKSGGQGSRLYVATRAQ